MLFDLIAVAAALTPGSISNLQPTKFTDQNQLQSRARCVKNLSPERLLFASILPPLWLVESRASRPWVERVGRLRGARHTQEDN